MTFIKKLNLIIFIPCFIVQILQAHDAYYHYDNHGRTALMNYVIEIEAELAIKKTTFDAFFDACFYKQNVYNGFIIIDGRIIHLYDSIIVRKIYTTDADVAQCKILNDEYDALIEHAIENIKIMVLNGHNLQARDHDGKSVSDYCSTYEIYTALKKLGAPFALLQGNYFDIAYRLCERFSDGVQATAHYIVASSYFKYFFGE